MNTNPPPFPDSSKPPGCWTLATYNVQDLFGATTNPTVDDPHPPENRLRNKMTRLSRVLHTLDADVVGLMEVETRGVLERLNAEALADLGYAEAVLIEGNDPERGIDVALLSRFPVRQVLSHAAEQFVDADGDTRRVFSRDCLECHLALPDGETVVVLVNHFKSKRGADLAATDALRARQAARVRALAEELSASGAPVAVIGDLNDTPDSPALNSLRDGLSDVMQDVPEGWRYTFVHAGQPERIDYLLATPGLARRLIPGSVLIPHDAFAVRASDHVPVRATFSLGAAAFAYPQSLTAAYVQTHRAVRRGHVPPRINAARFFPRDLHRWEGQTVIVTGIVLRVEETDGTGTVRLFLGHGDPERAFRATVFPNRRPEFAHAGIRDIAGYYKGKMVQGVGALHFYHGMPETAIETPGQLKIVRGDTPDGNGVQL